jgi:hypothetical protein
MEPGVPVVVGDLQDDVGEPAFLDPLGHVDDCGAHGIVVFEDLVLALVVATQNDDRAVPITDRDDPSNPLEIRSPQGTIGPKSRVDGPLIARRAAEEENRTDQPG